MCNSCSDRPLDLEPCTPPLWRDYHTILPKDNPRCEDLGSNKDYVRLNSADWDPISGVPLRGAF